MLYTKYDDEGDMQFYIYSIVVELICIDKHEYINEARFVIPKHTHTHKSQHSLWKLCTDNLIANV